MKDQNVIKVFDDLYDATMFLETEAELAYERDTPFSAQLYRTWDGRWRVGISWGEQMELDV